MTVPMAYTFDREAEILREGFVELLSLETSLKSPQAVASIRPYILWQIISSVEFRLSCLCDHERKIKNLPDYRDTSVTHGLSRYHDYLTRVALVDLYDLMASYNQLRCLETALRYVVHGCDIDRNVLEHVDGIEFDGLSIVVSDRFISSALEHATKYVTAVTRHNESLDGTVGECVWHHA